MVKLAQFILGPGKAVSALMFFMMGLGCLWQPLFTVFLVLSLVASIGWILSYKWARSIATESTRFTDWFWDSYISMFREE